MKRKRKSKLRRWLSKIWAAFVRFLMIEPEEMVLKNKKRGKKRKTRRSANRNRANA